jgi:hypothetical protein
MLTECVACGEPLFEYIKECPKCGTPNSAYEPEVADPKAHMPPMERAVAGIAATSFVMTFVFGMAVVSHLPGPVPPKLNRLFATALATTASAGLFIVGSEHLSHNAKRLVFPFLLAGYITWMVLAD